MANPTVHYPQVFAATIGKRLAHRRLARNITQAALAREAGIATRTLRRLEAGQLVTLDTFLRVVIALGLADQLLVALPQQEISPLQIMDKQGKDRRRARPRPARPARQTGPRDGGQRG